MQTINNSFQPPNFNSNNLPMSTLLNLRPDVVLGPPMYTFHYTYPTPPPSLSPTPLSGPSETPDYSGVRPWWPVEANPVALNLSSWPTGNNNQKPIVLHWSVSFPVLLLCPIISSLRVSKYLKYPSHYQSYQSSPEEAILIQIIF